MDAEGGMWLNGWLYVLDTCGLGKWVINEAHHSRISIYFGGTKMYQDIHEFTSGQG